MHSLPSLSTFETFQAWRADASQWLPVALDIARSHGLAHAAPHVFSTGTNLVVGLGDELILKIFPPMLRGQFISERLSLAQLRGRLSIPIPEILFEGERDGWPYPGDEKLTGGVADLDDYSACKIVRKEDWRDLFVTPFYFGCEADDRTNAWAFSRNNPFGW